MSDNDSWFKRLDTDTMSLEDDAARETYVMQLTGTSVTTLLVYFCFPVFQKKRDNFKGLFGQFSRFIAYIYCSQRHAQKGVLRVYFYQKSSSL